MLPELAVQVRGFVHFWCHQHQRSPPDAAACLPALQPMPQNAQELMYRLRALLCRNPHDWQDFAALFYMYWQQPLSQLTFDANAPTRPARDTATEAHAGTDNEAVTHPLPLRTPHTDALHQRDWRLLEDEQELQRVAELLTRLGRQLPRRATRRYQASHRGRIDLPGSLRRALRQQGEWLSVQYQRRRRRPVTLHVLLDISQSMDIHNYLFFQLLPGLQQQVKQLRVYGFDSQLHDLGPLLQAQQRGTRLRAALRRHSGLWHGGTRIGSCLQQYLQDRHSLQRPRGWLLILSDSRDNGPSTLLEQSLLALRQRCQQLHWLDPLGNLNDAQLTVSQRRRRAIIRRHCHLYHSAHCVDSLQSWLRQWPSLRS